MSLDLPASPSPGSPDDSGFSSASVPRSPPGARNAPPPAEIPDFRLVHRLGRGGFGEVWLGLSLAGEYRAIKILPKDARTEMEIEGIRLYQTRARRHPNLIEIVHIGQTDTHYYYVLDLADSLVTVPVFSYDAYEPKTLRRELDRRSRLGVDAAIPIARGILSGLQHLHAQGLLHRDVKPDNIIFIDNVPKLSDVGLVTRSADVGDAGLTPLYAPPEGVVDPSGDLYGMGRVLAEMLLGWLPAEPPPFRPPRSMAGDARLCAALAVASKAAHPDPRKRYAFAERMAADLEAIAEADPPLPRRLLPIAGAVGAVVAVIAIAGTIGLVSLGPRGGALVARRVANRRPAVAAAGSDSTARPAPFTSPHGIRFHRERREYARAPANDLFDLTRGFTIEFWYKGITASPGGLIMARARREGQQMPWSLREENYRLVLSLAGTDVESPQFFYAGAMDSYAVSWEAGSGNVAFFKDGALMGTGQGPPGLVRWRYMLSFGGLENGARSVDAVLDEVRIWNRVRTLDEIYASNDRPLTDAEIADPSLVGYWRFDEGAGQEARDATGRGNVIVFGQTPVEDDFDPSWTGSTPLAADASQESQPVTAESPSPASGT